ncbi:MAG: acyltransferase [Pseudomonadota bacterium]|nr:acyltransferase [Pseudomonadota bacterium]
MDGGVKHELRALTSMRGIAAWFVVLYHIRLSIAGLPPAATAFFAKGYLAVDFFFLLSGFVIWLSWGERLRAEGLRTAPAFLQKRIARIWPLHLFMLAGAVALALILAATGRADPADYPFGQLPLHILLLHNWGFTDRLVWNDPSWSISCELAAYLLFPLLALTIDWRRLPSWVVVGAIVALLLMLHAAMDGAPTLGTDIAHLGLPRCLFEFAAGSAVGALWLRWREAPARPAIVAACLSALLFAAWLSGLLPETLAIPACFAAALLALALTSGMARNPLDGAAIHYLGEISYATYLGHFLLFVVFKLALVDDPHAVPPVLIALYLALVLANSVALYHLVERPAQRWVNRWRLPARSGTKASTAHF